jgi:hypothetical protein
MRNFIITAIVVLAAAKAKIQSEECLTNPVRREKSEGELGVANLRAVHGNRKLHPLHRPRPEGASPASFRRLPQFRPIQGGADQ